MKIPASRTIKKFLNPFNRLGIILMYHRVANVDYDPLGLNVSPKHFEEQMRIIKKYSRPVQMRHMGKNLNRFSFGKTDIAVTLDDGYSDNFYNAKPIFERHDIPATFFIITGCIDSQEEFFWESLRRAVLAPETLPQILDIIIAGKKYHWEIKPSGTCQTIEYGQTINDKTSAKLSRSEFYNVLIQILGTSSIEERRVALKLLGQWSGQDLAVRKECLPMTSGDLLSLADCPLFEIGAHTVNHPKLAFIPVQKQNDEINLSKTDLEKRVNKAIVSFSYPHGNYNEETVKLVERLKFQNACTVVQNPVMRNSNPYLLPRFAVQNWNGDQFEQNLQNWLEQ